MKKIVLATCNKHPAILPSDQIFADALQTMGAEVIGAPWNGNLQPFVDANHVVIRSTWDYFEVVDQFYTWFNQLEANGVSVSNSIDILRWNAKKHYLFDMIEQGLNVIPSYSIEANIESIIAVMNGQNLSQAVLKCVVSGSALGMSLLHSREAEEINQALVKASSLSAHGLMLQPFYSEVHTEGELSMIFIDGQFSHAVQKIPKEGEFRVQTEFGGQYRRYLPAAELIDDAKVYLKAVPGSADGAPLYARVDGLVIDGQFLLMEIELTEPELMFPLATEAAQRMAAAVMAKL